MLTLLLYFGTSIFHDESFKVEVNEDNNRPMLTLLLYFGTSIFHDESFKVEVNEDNNSLFISGLGLVGNDVTPIEADESEGVFAL